jgi:catechol 2,3-dioxygenase-like lactoylglutathione lyase family enzyme
MIRYHGGATELKFIVGAGEDNALIVDPFEARGIRGLHLQLPESRRQSIFSRCTMYGLEEPRALAMSAGPAQYSTIDPAGNPLTLSFYNDDPIEPDLTRMHFDFGVIDPERSGKFLQDILGMTPVLSHTAPFQYQLGQSAINLHAVPEDRPALVGMPHEMLGMSLLQFVVHDVYEAREMILAKGGSISIEPYNVGDLAVVMFVLGPDGIPIEFGAAM